MNLNKSVQIKLLNLPQYYRRLVILLLDIVLIIASIYPNINRLTVNQNQELSSYQWLLIAPVICIPTLFFLGNYRSLTRYLGSKSAYLLSFRLFVALFFTYLFGIVFGKAIPNLSIWIWIWLTCTWIMSLSRFLIRDWLQSVLINSKKHHSF